MKSLNLHRSLLTLAVGLCLAGLLVAAEPNGSAGSQPPQPAPAEPAQRPFAVLAQFAPGFARFAEVLTEEQRTSLREAMVAQRADLRALQEKLRGARLDLFTASVAGKFDEELVRQKAMALARLEVDMSVLRAKALSQMRPPLTAAQIDQIKNAVPPNTREGKPQLRRHRPELPRDENGLPPKEPPDPQPKS